GGGRRTGVRGNDGHLGLSGTGRRATGGQPRIRGGGQREDRGRRSDLDGDEACLAQRPVVLRGRRWTRRDSLRRQQLLLLPGQGAHRLLRRVQEPLVAQDRRRQGQHQRLG